jgi:hypothetical protein
LLSGRLARFCEGEMVDVEIVTWEMVLGKDALADLTSLIDRVFGQQHGHLAEFRIWTLTY